MVALVSWFMLKGNMFHGKSSGLQIWVASDYLFINHGQSAKVSQPQNSKNLMMMLRMTVMTTMDSSVGSANGAATTVPELNLYRLFQTVCF